MSSGLITIRIVGSGDSAAAAAAACAATAAELRPLLGSWLLAEGPEELHEVAVQRLLARRLWLAVAESCTGGLLAGRVTDVAGASAVFRGGCVCYADEAKTALLGVEPALLAAHGAVSEPVAAAMASGAAARLHADLALAITGIAGPGGGTPEKPVGTVCFGMWREGAPRSWTLHIPDLGRAFVRERAVIEALAAILRAVPG